MPTETIINNVAGQVILFEAARGMCPNAKILIAGSSEEYGLVNKDELPITEENPLRPLSTYGVSKVAQDLLGWQYYKSYGMRIVRTRAFNHIGPRRGEVFVCSSFAKQIVEIEKGERKPIIEVGDLSTIRDFTDVRDMVRGYWQALELGEIGEVYNIGSGKGVKIQRVLDLLLEISGVSIKVAIHKDRIRPSDVPILICDYRKFWKQTNWCLTISIRQSLSDLLDYWREKIA
jgi:GDP-4-dehydro-6-deoxy-D-mannose reductase